MEKDLLKGTQAAKPSDCDVDEIANMSIICGPCYGFIFISGGIMRKIFQFLARKIDMTLHLN